MHPYTLYANITNVAAECSSVMFRMPKEPDSILARRPSITAEVFLGLAQFLQLE
jgi:hypothetical protein